MCGDIFELSDDEVSKERINALAEEFWKRIVECGVDDEDAMNALAKALNHTLVGMTDTKGEYLSLLATVTKVMVLNYNIVLKCFEAAEGPQEADEEEPNHLTTRTIQ